MLRSKDASQNGGAFLFSHYTPKIYQKLILNLAISAYGSYCNTVIYPGTTTIPATPFPSEMEIDYVRVWQRDIQPGLIDLCENRHLVGGDKICLNETGSFSFEGAHGDLNWWVSPNLSITSNGEHSITIEANPNTDGQKGHIYIAETNSPCDVNYTIDHLIDIGKPPLPIITDFGCGNGYTIQSSLPFNFTWENNILTGFPIISGGAIGDPNANIITGYVANFTPTSIDKVCIPYTFMATNNCGATTTSGFIHNNCIPSTNPLETLCDRTTALIDMAEFGLHLNIYPNPASSSININFTDGYEHLITECKIYNCMSYILSADLTSLQPSNQFECSGWERGNYVVLLKIETGQTMARLISIQ